MDGSQAAPLPCELLPGSPLQTQGSATPAAGPDVSSRLVPQGQRASTSIDGNNLRGMAASSSAPAGAGGDAHERAVRSLSVDAEAIERYSQLVSNDAKNLNRLRKASVTAFATSGTHKTSTADGAGNVSEEASNLAQKRWSTATTLVRSAVAVNRDVKALRNMVGTVARTSLTTEQMEAKLLNDELMGQNGVIMPDSIFKSVWDLLQVVLLLYVALVVPYRAGFSVPTVVWSSFWWFEVLVDIYFVADLILNFLFAYEDPEERKIIVNREAIRQKYLRSWFLVDFLSVLPISYVQQMFGHTGSDSSNSSGSTKLLKILRMVRLAKLLRLAKLQRLIKKYSEEIKGLAASAKLGCTLGAALLLAHMITCAWYLLGDVPNGWVSAKFPANATDCPPPSSDSCTDMVCEPGTPIGWKYLQTFWWTISILIGSEVFSDINPHTDREVIFTLVLQLVGAIVFSLVIGTVGTLLMSSKLLEEKVDRQLAELREFMQEKQIPKALRKRIREFMEQLYRAKTGYDVKEVLDHLPPKLAGELLDSMYRDTIVQVPLFHSLEEGAVRDICLAMKPLSVMRGEYIYKENQLGREMYVVENGEVQLSRYGLVIGVMHKSSFFGESALQPGRRVRDRSAYALVDSTLALLTKIDCERIARDYPNMMASFEHVAARKTKMEAIRMNQLLQQAALDLNVDVQSSVMQHVLSTVEQMTTQRTADEVEEKAIVMLQSHARGWLARKKALTQTAIKRGVLCASTSALNLEVDDAHAVVKTSPSTVSAASVAEDSGFPNTRRRMRLSSTKSGAKYMTRSMESIEFTRQKTGLPKRAKRAKSWRGVYLTAGDDNADSSSTATLVDEATINEVAATMVHEIMNAREGPQPESKQEETLVARLDLDGDGKVDVAGYDTTGDGVIDALDTDLDGRVDTDFIAAALRGTKSQSIGDHARNASSALSAECETRLGEIESTLARILQAQEVLFQKHDKMQHVMEDISSLLRQQ